MARDYTPYDFDYFDGGKAYQSYRESWVWSAFPEMLGLLLDSPRIVLDFGCAKGFLVKNLVARGIDARGVDVSPYALSCTPPEIRDRFKLLKGPILPFEDKRFDWIYTFETLEHVPEEDIDATLREFQRVGKRGVFGSIFIEGQIGGADPTHVLVRSRAWWNKKLRAHGFFEDDELVARAREFPCIRAMRLEPFCYHNAL